MVLMSFLFASYFSTILVYCLFYAYKSVSAMGGLPCKYCQEPQTNEKFHLASENCYDSTTQYEHNGTIRYGTAVTQNYFDNVLLRKSNGIGQSWNTTVFSIIMLYRRPISNTIWPKFLEVVLIAYKL